MTYQELKLFLDTLSPEQLAQTVQTYAGDIDTNIPVIGTTNNTDDEMGGSLDGFDTAQIFLVLE
jgi:hypothetical protein